MLRILVTGARGMLGSDMCEVLGSDYEVTPYDIEDFDIVDLEPTQKAVREVSPQVIIHLAAFTDVEACEDELERALGVNSVGAMNIAMAASEAEAYLVYLSTDYVFDGAKGEPYIETDVPSPINHYGLSKLRGERHVQELVSKHLIIRTSWLFGPNGKNFIDTIVARASGGAVLKVVNDQRGSPTYSLDLARGIRQAFERKVEGVLHMTNTGVATWFDVASYAIGLAGIETDITAIPGSEYPTRAKRPPYSVLGSAVAEAAGIDALPHWREGVKHHLRRKNLLKEGAAR
jgi:dTDP-4-dehydrorhamnose reductase